MPDDDPSSTTGVAWNLAQSRLASAGFGAAPLGDPAPPRPPRTRFTADATLHRILRECVPRILGLAATTASAIRTLVRACD